jgi:hypothetical protein
MLLGCLGLVLLGMAPPVDISLPCPVRRSYFSLRQRASLDHFPAATWPGRWDGRNNTRFLGLDAWEEDDSEETAPSKRREPRLPGEVVLKFTGSNTSFTHGPRRQCGAIGPAPRPLFYTFCTLLL